MRILHTSDWHVGRTIRGRSRAVEHTAVLAEIVGVAQAEAVDLVLVAGDQFDTAAPAPDAERIVWRSLLDLAEVAPVVVVAGNHDNPLRLDAVAPLLAAGGVHSGARLSRPHEGGLLTIELATGEMAKIALLPFLSQRGIVRADELMDLDADQHAGRYDARVKVIIERLCEGFTAETVNLVVAHLMMAGGVVAAVSAAPTRSSTTPSPRQRSPTRPTTWRWATCIVLSQSPPRAPPGTRGRLCSWTSARPVTARPWR